MAKVGTDRRLNYYQMAGDDVIAELRSHPYGLTEPEATRRLSHNGVNYVKSTSFGTKRYAGSQPWFIALQLAGIVLAWQLEMQPLAAVLAFLLLTFYAVERWREQNGDTLEHHIHTLQSSKATVRRNDVLKVIDAQELVVGDIVALSVDTIVPADIRILTSNILIADDSLLFASGHTHKFAHALNTELPLSQRHNTAFAGTKIVHGSGEGIVVATGMQTELGRIFIHAEQTKPKASLFSQLFRTLTKQFTWAAFVLFAVFYMAVPGSWVEPRDAALFGLALVVALLPIGLTIAASGLFATFVSRVRKWRVRLQLPSTSDRLGTVDTLLVDEADFVIDTSHVITEFHVGKQIFQVEPTGYQPRGKVLTHTGKAVPKKTLHELQLFFEAAVLSTHSKLLPPDAEHTKWRAVGPSTDGALLTLAGKAGLDIDAVRQAHPIIAHFTYDHHRELASAVHEYDHRHLVFVHGATPAVLSKTSRLWDAGHTRKFTKADQKHWQEYHDNQVVQGNHTVALAYRQLPKRAAGTRDMSEVEEELTLLGIAVVTQPVQPSAPLAIKAARENNVAVLLLTERSKTVAVGVAKQLGITSPTVVTHDQFVGLADNQLFDIVARGGAIFCHLTSEQRLRLITIAKVAGRSIAVTGKNLGDVPALRHADIGIVPTEVQASVVQQADITLIGSDLHAFMRTLQQSRNVSTHVRQLIYTALSDHAMLTWTILIGFALFASERIPLAITVPMILLAAGLQVLPYAAIGNDLTRQAEARTHPSSLLPHPSLVTVIIALFAGLLMYANFVFFFARENLSPGYIDDNSNLYLRAATVTLVGLVLCMWINLLFTRAQHTDNLLNARLRSKPLMRAFVASSGILLLAIYAPLFQQLFGTRSLSLPDWLSVLWVGVFFFAVRWVAHHERKRSRHAIITLHQEIHGKDTGAKI